MFKKSKKKLSILLVLAMVMTMLSGLAAPAGATTTPVTGVEIGSEPTVVAPGSVTLQSIRFAESGASIGNIQTGNTITVTLPSGVNFVLGQTIADLFVAGPRMSAAIAVFHPSGSDTALATDNSVTLTLNRVAGTDFDAAAFTVTLPVNVTTVGSGAINATVTTNTTAISGGTFAVGTFGTAAVTVDGTGTVGTVSRFVGPAQSSGITIRLRENAAGAFRTDIANRVVLTLPEGVTWNVYGAPAGIEGAIDTDPRKLNLWRTTTAGVATTFTITGIQLNVNRLAALGDLTVTVAGEGTNSGITGSVVLARVSDFDITVRRPAAITTTPPLNAGRISPVLTNMLELVEATPGSLIAGGTITLTLPAGLRFDNIVNLGPTAATTRGNVVVSAGTRVSDSVYRFAVTTASTSASTVTFTFPAGSILVSPTTAAGDVTVTVAGTAGAAGTAVIAAVRPVATVAAAAAPRLRVATVNQAAGDIVITEAAAGRIRIGNITLTLPTGVVFNGTPTVTRTSGNITLGTVSVTSNTLTIPVTAVSGTASVITVSGVRYDVDRLVSDGDVSVTLAGTALLDAAVDTAFPVAVAANRVRVANARIGGVVSSVFTIGALNFVSDGVTRAIDAAPAIVDGRTLLPLRFAALAVGVNEDNILWDPVRRTVTLIGDRVVQFQLGSSSMLINGVAVPLDVAPSIVNGRTMLPIRALAQALRADIVWDGTARTVTVTPRQ